MTKKTTLPLLAAVLVLASTPARAQVKEAAYEIRNQCKVTSRLYTPEGKPAELELRVDDATNPQQGFGLFKKLVKTEDGLLVPLMGFNLCDSYEYGPLSVTVTTAGDYQRIDAACGGTWQAVAGEASLTLQLSTQKAVRARVKLDGAYGNGVIHSGLVKKPIEAFTCEAPDYAAASALLDGASAKTVKGAVARGVFTAGK